MTTWHQGDILFAPLLGELTFTGQALGLIWFKDFDGCKIAFEADTIDNRLNEEMTIWQKFGIKGKDGYCTETYHLKESGLKSP